MLTWILLGLALWIVGFGFVMVLMRMASDEDRGSRRIQRSIDPFSDVAVTQFGSSGRTEIGNQGTVFRLGDVIDEDDWRGSDDGFVRERSGRGEHCSSPAVSACRRKGAVLS